MLHPHMCSTVKSAVFVDFVHSHGICWSLPANFCTVAAVGWPSSLANCGETNTAPGHRHRRGHSPSKFADFERRWYPHSRMSECARTSVSSIPQSNSQSRKKSVLSNLFQEPNSPRHILLVALLRLPVSTVIPTQTIRHTVRAQTLHIGGAPLPQGPVTSIFLQAFARWDGIAFHASDLRCFDRVCLTWNIVPAGSRFLPRQYLYPGGTSFLTSSLTAVPRSVVRSRRL
jgi:hypothetical protein